MNVHVFFLALLAVIFFASATGMSVNSPSRRRSAAASVSSTTMTYDHVTRSRQRTRKKPMSRKAWNRPEQFTTTTAATADPQPQSPRKGWIHGQSSPTGSQFMKTSIIILPNRRCPEDQIIAVNGECVDAFEMVR